MKHKAYKRIAALTLVLMLVLALSGTAFADADMKGEAGKIGEFTTAATAQGNKVIIYKEIVAINPANSDVFAPAISYSYAIDPGSAGSEITDSQSVKATVKAGISGATITETVSWNNADKLKTSADGVGNRKPITVDFSNVNWTGAGVYRYMITETPSTYAASSVTEGDTTHKRYMDVYVRDAATSGYEIYGYVCFEVDGAITAASEANAKKTEGFVNSDSTAADKYYTYDLEITKTVVNDRAMENHDFPFTVTFTNTGVTATNFKLDTAVSATASPDSNYAGALTSDTPKLRNTGSVKYIGIPYGTSVTIKETVDVAGSTYQVTTTGADGTQVNQSITGTVAGVDSNNAAINAQTTTSLTTKKVDFTNTLLLISPTGVVLRVAPYVCMLAAGIFLLTLSRRRRAAED